MRSLILSSMSRKVGSLFVLVCALMLAGCGKGGTKSGGSPATNQAGGGSLTLLSFAFPGCIPCQNELPELNRLLTQDPQLKARVVRRLFVTAGQHGAGAPDAALSADFHKRFAPDFQLNLDRGWRTYRQYVSQRTLVAPADVVLDAAGHPMKVWSGNIVPQEIVGFLKANLK